MKKRPLANSTRERTLYCGDASVPEHSLLIGLRQITARVVRFWLVRDCLYYRRLGPLLDGKWPVRAAPVFWRFTTRCGHSFLHESGIQRERRHSRCAGAMRCLPRRPGRIFLVVWKPSKLPFAQQHAPIDLGEYIDQRQEKTLRNDEIDTDVRSAIREIVAKRKRAMGRRSLGCHDSADYGTGRQCKVTTCLATVNVSGGCPP